MEDKWSKFKAFIGTICFVLFGVVSFMDINYPDNPINIGVGIVIGLLFSFISKKVLSILVSMFNGKLKTTHGKKIVKEMVSKTLVYMLPFAVMAFFSTYYLGWTANSAFVSSAIMTCAALTAVEIGKLKEKPSIVDTIATTVSSSIISAVWVMSIGLLRVIPGYVSAIIKLVLPLISQFKI